MKINSSTIWMGSSRTYNSSTEITQTTKQTNLSTGQTNISQSSFLMSYQERLFTQTKGLYDTYEESQDKQDMPLLSDLYSNLKNNNRLSVSDAKSTLQEMHEKLIQEIEEFMERIREQLLGISSRNTSTSSILDFTTNTTQPGALWSKQTSTNITYTESEQTTFTGTGTVQTQDGRSIDFHISMEMSRSFMESAETLSESVEYILTDPLVIHLSDAPETISEQNFFFDIDCDGVKEEISQLTPDCGFLVLDKNENGIIDDGNELFGTQSGNGFQDLRAYDEDGNGWIDENDSVYSQLKVWTKDKQGRDQLTDLATGDIGAIYLGSAQTLYSHNNSQTNHTDAVVRQTGVFLHESTGQAGIIQQIDFATAPATNEVA